MATDLPRSTALRLPSTVAVAIVVGALLSGCTGTQDSASQAAFVCPGNDDICPKTGPRSWTMENLDLQVPAGWALRVTAGDAERILVRNVTLAFVDHGLVLVADCMHCQIELDGVRVKGTSQPRDSGITLTARSGNSATIRLANVTVAGYQLAIDAMPLGNTGTAAVLDGVAIDCEWGGIFAAGPAIILDRVDARGCGGYGANLRPSGDLSVSRSTFSRDTVGVQVHGENARTVFRDTVFRDNRKSGLVLEGTGTFAGLGLAFANNSWATPAWAFDSQFSGSLHASSFVGNANGFSQARSLPFDATDNYWGSSQGPTPYPAPPTPWLGDSVDALLWVPYRSVPP